MAVKGNNKTYLFQIKAELPAITMYAVESLNEETGELYGLLNGKLIPIDAYDNRKNAYSHHIYECLGEGELIGRVFPDGVLSDDLKRFLKEPNHEKYRV